MNLPCQTVRDLLPLYHDRVSSPETDRLVEEHLNGCEPCKALYSQMCASDSIEARAFDAAASERLADSYKQVKKKRRRRTALIIAVICASILAVQFALVLGAASCLLTDSLLQRPDVHTDPAEYSLYRSGPNAVYEYREKLMDESIWPQELTPGMNVLNYTMVYYNPWDPQYCGYMEVEFTPEAYGYEMKRLGGKSFDSFAGVYGAERFEGYELAAMLVDGYHGFVYALTDGESRIIYVELMTCNFFFDLDYERYVPREYLPVGLDMSENNEYGETHSLDDVYDRRK
ncbi:MAG: zf-HC2 domain-containing protein [Clostridia bacterium]|nr:zf-HC2 domain-containing protein [Clostridia bacterium]